MPEIRTIFEYPPIPNRRWDWRAVLVHACGDDSLPEGWGPTEADAIRDLREQLEAVD